MGFTDSNGIAYVDTSDPADALHTTINQIPTSVSSWINSKTPIWKVADASAAATLATTYPPSMSAPLYVHRQDNGGLYRNVGAGYVEIATVDPRISDIYQVADIPARTALATALNVSVTGKPLYVTRMNAVGGPLLERTINGTQWIAVDGRPLATGLRTSNQGPTTGEGWTQDTATFQADGVSSYLVEWSLKLSGTVVDDRLGAFLRQGTDGTPANNPLITSGLMLAGGVPSVGQNFYLRGVFTPSAGSITVRGYISRAGGTGTVSSPATVGDPSILTVRQA